MNTVSDSTHEVPIIEEDPTPTQKIWRPVADLDQEHVALFGQLQAAMSRYDIESATRIRIRIAEIEVEQRQAHLAAREYLVRQAAVRDGHGQGL